MAIQLVLLLATLIGGLVAASNWDKILKAFKGKRVAILGARGTGKTHLHSYLSTGVIPEEYIQTLAPEKISGRMIKLNDLELILKDGLDVSGDESAINIWKDLSQKSDIIIYLFRADQLLYNTKKTNERIEIDFNNITNWIKEAKTKPELFIIGTHCDLDAKFTSLKNTAGNYSETFFDRCGLPIFKPLTSRANLILGSMKDLEGTRDVTSKILKHLLNKVK